MAKKVILKDENLIEVMPITRAELVLDSAGNQALHSHEFLATDTQPGLMSPDDKQKLETVTGNTVDTELSNTSTNPVQNKVLTQIINSIRDEYVKSAVISGNKITITDQSDNTIEFSNSAYQIVTDTIDGLVPKYDAVDGIIETHLTDWVLTNHNGTLGWYKLPANAFKNDNTTYTFVSGNGGFTVTPSGGTAQVVSIGNVDWANITNKPDTFTPSAHTHATDNITKLTGYTKATSASDLATTDTLNTALGKLEYKAHYAYNWVTTVTATDTDEYINKWDEIVGFLDSVKEGTDILEEFVTCNTAQTITGLKTFESNSSTTGVSLILKNKGWTGSMSTAMDFYNGHSYTVPNARIETKMVGSGNAGGTLIFYTQTKHESTNPNPNGLTERFRIGDDGTSKITGTFTVTENVIANKFITSGGTSSQFVKGDGSLDSNTYLTSLPSHNHSYLKEWSDTRSVETTPNDYNDTFKVVGIKSAGTTLGLTSTQTGNHATIIGWRGWCDSTGGYSWEIASTDKNRLYVRSGSTTSWNNKWQAIAYLNDIPTVTNYYWADIKVSSSSSTKTTPTFKTATATVSVTTPLVNSTGRLTLNATNTGLDLKFGNDDTKSVILNGTAFKPFDDATGKLSLGTSNARWNALYSGNGNFTGDVTLYAASGNSPHLVFQRGNLYDGTYDWDQYVIGDTFKIRYNPSQSSAATWTDVLSMYPSMITTPWGITANSFVKSGSSDSYVLLGGGGHKALSDFLLETEFASKELSSNLTTITKTLTVTKDWMDTGIKYTDLATGTYAIQVYSHTTGNSIYYCYWSGIMTWYGSTTNSSDSDEILLHRGAHAYNRNTIYLRTIHTAATDGRHMRLQIAANKNWSSATFTFNFKKLI